MAAWTSNDLPRICRYLDLNVMVLSSTVQARMVRLLALAPLSVTQVQADLTELDSLDASVSTNSGGDGLIKAGELAWSSFGGKTGGYKSRMQMLINRVAIALDLDPFRPDSSGARLIRS
jgi:hypothetical protein